MLGPSVIVIAAEESTTRAPDASSTSTLTKCCVSVGSNGAPVILSPILASAGCCTNASLAATQPLTVVVGEGGLSVRSLPGWPLKSLDCFAWGIQVKLLPEAHGTLTLKVTPTEPPGGNPRPRSWRTLPAIVAEPAPLSTGAGGAWSVNPAGGVRFAEPSCCVPVRFLKVAVNETVPPPFTMAGAMVREYGLVAAPAGCAAKAAKASSATSNRAPLARARWAVIRPLWLRLR